ncbi:efflux RND transporter periplasmic adaptor subunit [Massilia sp. TSP1-1-2]|uniref:efflux RND transporter periplasmic adaptor subunit n=1 Tax=Massilia sp. TSP1-1-2 TaxID=2804649 RepID=UPI003CEE8AF8
MNRPTELPPFSPEAATPPPGLDAAGLVAALQQHRRERRGRNRADYWSTYCALMRALCRATAVLLIQRTEAGWTVLGAEAQGDDWALRNWEKVLEKRGERTLEKGFAFTPMQDDAGRLRILAVVQTTGIGEALLVMDIPERERGQLNELLMRALLVADFGEPEPPEAAPAGAGLLDLAAQVVAEKHFEAAALVLVNNLAAGVGASQVALGWTADGAVRTVAISHLDRFERNTENVQLMDEVFDEALGHNGPVWYAAGEDSAPLAAHGKLARVLGMARVHTLPLAASGAAGVGGKGEAAGAVLLFGFAQEPAQRPDEAELRLMFGFLQPWLEQLRQRDRWWGARLRDWTRARLARWLGPGKVWTRVLVATASALLLFVLLGSMSYRFEASAQLTTDSTRLVSAQFDGRIDAVQASAGDVVRKGALLASLDTRELRQQQLELGADRQRLEAEADKARAAGSLAELGVAEARFAQADARLTRIEQYLAQAQAVAPFDGVVVAGERKDLLNAPVKKGDNLFRVARIDGLYVEIMVAERDVRYILPNATGELRLLARPGQSIAFTLSSVIPVAQVKGQEGNHFLVKAKLSQAPEAWWRPGMSGMAVIDGGQRNVGWILTHGLVDSLRMKLWWLG